MSCFGQIGHLSGTFLTLTDKRAEDHKNVKDILNNVLEIADVSIINLYCLGGKGQNRNLKPRLLLATLNSKDKQHEALANTWKLKGNQEWKKVYVDPDRTPEQRKEHNKLLEEMRARRNNGEQVFLAQEAALCKRGQWCCKRHIESERKWL